MRGNRMSRACRTILCLVIFSLYLPSALMAADNKSQTPPLVHYRFHGNAKDEIKGQPDFELKNTQFKNNALYLNGKYEYDGTQEGYRAVCKTPKLDFAAFTVVIRFNAEEFAPNKSNLFTGGTSSRWFGLNLSPVGNLTVTLNNQQFSQEIPGIVIRKGKWTIVACGVDVPQHKIVVYLNGKKAGDIVLPADFKFDIASDAKDTDKVWTFTNYSNSNVFHGLVGEVIIYGKMLSAKEFEQIL